MGTWSLRAHGSAFGGTGAPALESGWGLGV